MAWETYSRGAHTIPRRFQLDELDDGWMATDYALGEVVRGLASLEHAQRFCESRVWDDSVQPDFLVGA